MDKALARLRDPSGEALAALARLVVDETTATPLNAIASPRWIASQIATALEAVTQGDLARDFAARRIDAGRDRWASREEPVRDGWPAEMDAPLRELLSQPWVPDEQLTFRILDQPAMRALVSEVLTTMITRFRGRAREGGLLKGLGGAARRSRGLFGGVAGNLQGLAENVVGAVKDEVEHGLDEIVKDFVASTTRDALRAIASHMADPNHKQGFADLRLGILDVMLDTPVKDLVGEVDKAGPVELIEVVLAGLRGAIAEEDFVDRTEERLTQILDETGDGTLGAWLEEVDLREVWSDTTTELVAQRLGAVVQTDAFEAWWTDLHA